MGIGKMKWKIENGKSDFSFFCFRFTIYSEEQIFFIDIHLLFKKHSGENSRNEINWWYGRGERRGTYNIRGQMYEYIFAQSRGCCVSYPSNILQRDWKIVYEQLTLFYGEVFFLSGLKIVEYHSGNIRISSSLNWRLFLLTRCVYISRAWAKIFDGS